MKVTITDRERAMAAYVGFMREFEDTCGGKYCDTHGRDPHNGWQLHIDGAIAEYVVAKAFGLPWSGVAFIGADDVGDCQIRSTHHTHGKLIVHKRDDSDKKFILVRGGPLEFEIAGWLYGYEAKQDRHWGELLPGRPAFNVPAANLHYPETIPFA